MILRIIILILINTSIVLSQSTSPFRFINFNFSARAAALSHAFVAMPNDASALLLNPATLHTVDEKFFSTTFIKHALDMNSGNIVYIPDNLIEDGSLAFSANYTSYGTFEYADINGNKDGRTFGANNLAFAASYSNELDSNLFYGVTAKYLFVGLEKASTSALALDAGLFYKLKDGRTNIGASILNAGIQLNKLAGESESIPTDIRLGVNHRLRGLPLLVNFSFHSLADQKENFFKKFTAFSIGGELYLGNYIQARLGFDNQVRQYVSPDLSAGFSGFSGGVGVKTKDINFDYSFNQFGSAVIVHRMSLNFDF